ncbi:hypothetical protein VMCG_04683 [Cytospora schulzeri]|uniref:glycogenin glucosyltransferase n=1 Tax=Cytospora schulzeri TaxID=448051 RepID=A0A423WS46_9PEZI|nr:hypothetical protein VMCG_04683 [Valsa malicola]
MAAQSGEDVYVTLLLSDTYLPGALVLAHSLRDAGTTKKLAVLVTLDTVSTEVSIFDYVIPVPRIRNEQPANLFLMNRADLHSAFTKVNLWIQTQFRKIVYIDADIVAYRAPDELFDLPHPFSAAPDIGWPDLFNSGVMVLSPNKGDYDAMIAMTEQGISFDGADQGLLNMHFKDNYNRLSFSYNVTPSGHYQYVPAYKHFQSSINMVHFIGEGKPWSLGREASSGGETPYGEMIGKWWAVYDRHYGQSEDQKDRKVPEIIQYFVKGEFRPQTTTFVVPTAGPQPTESSWDAQRRGSKLTDFPTAVERPSLPVTPAPVRRPKFWGAGDIGDEEENEDEEQLPSASGVPKQSEWKLGSSGASGGDDSGTGAGLEGHDITKRSLPFGSEDIMAQSEATPAASGSAILEPSYHGPGAAWEKDEGYLQHSTAMPPSEEERDVLQT